MLEAGGGGEEEEEVICEGLSWVWQAMFFLGSLPLPCAYIRFGLATAHGWWWRDLGASVLGFSLACLLLFLFSAPSDTRMDRPLVAYVFVYSFATCGGLGLGYYKRGINAGVIGTGITLVVGWIICYFLLQARKRIARSLTPNQLQDFVVGSVLIYGGMKLSGLLYLTAQGYKCLQEDVKYCSATTVPVMSISFMICMILVYRLAILPLATAATTRSQVGSFRNITMKNRASMLGLLVATQACTS